MSAVLIISIFLLLITSFAILRSKRSASKEDPLSGYLPPPARGLFDDAADVRELPGEVRVEATREARRRRLEGLSLRAASGDLSALDEAHACADLALYREVLDAFVKQCAGDASKLRALASHVIGSGELRADARFAEALLASWRISPEQIPIASLLRIAALSDDAAAYQRAVEAVLDGWKQGRAPEFTAGRLRQLFESEYWLLGAEAKRSGAGFVLKDTLADARRQLAVQEHGEGEGAAPAARHQLQ